MKQANHEAFREESKQFMNPFMKEASKELDAR